MSLEELSQDEILRRLEHEYCLLRIIHHRNKNQHRVAVWWKHLNSLKRNLTKLLPILKKMNREDGQSNEKIRRQGFEICRKIHCFLVPKAFYAFNGIIALGQFITLGLALVGLLSTIDYLVKSIEGLDEYLSECEETTAAELNEKAEEDFYGNSEINDEIGEEVSVPVVERKADDMVGKASKDSMLKKQKQKKKKTSMDEIFRDDVKTKKKKTSMDDIFGDVKVKKKKRPSPAIDDIFGSQDKKKKKSKKKKSAIDDIFG